MFEAGTSLGAGSVFVRGWPCVKTVQQWKHSLVDNARGVFAHSRRRRQVTHGG